jgi:hypothetical protein
VVESKFVAFMMAMNNVSQVSFYVGDVREG